MFWVARLGGEGKDALKVGQQVFGRSSTGGCGGVAADDNVGKVVVKCSQGLL
jgi:hypothetical protein